jgi:hypothetical protein
MTAPQTATSGVPRRVVYRPARGIGIGHLLVSWAVYGTLAQRLGAGFFSTLTGTVFDPAPSTEPEFMAAHFAPIPDAPHMVLGHAATAEALAPGTLGRAVIIGRQDTFQRPGQEFPALASAKLLDRQADQDQIAPEGLAGYDTIYIDSVIPKAPLIATLGQILPIVDLAPRHVAAAAAQAGPDPYVAVHLRHGNGEPLGGRPEGGTPAFETRLAQLASRAEAQSKQLGGAQILCLSDNATTAAQLAQLCGGRSLGDQDLPDIRFQNFFRRAKPQREGLADPRWDRMFTDLAVLCGAASLVAGASQFAQAAKLLGGHKRFQIVSLDGTLYSSDAK